MANYFSILENPHEQYKRVSLTFSNLSLNFAIWSSCSEPQLALSLVFADYIKLHSFPGGSDGKVSACNVGDLSLIPGLGRSRGEGNGNPLQDSCLENSMDGGAW